MFKRKLAQARSKFFRSKSFASPVVLEGLEGRCLMSGSHFGGFGGFGDGGPGGGDGGRHGGDRGVTDTIVFSQAPSAVQTGLTSLASTDGLTAPTSTQTVYLGNSNGVESYTLDLTGTGTVTQITVDQNGKPVTEPTRTTTTFGAITNTAVTTELTRLATALSLTAPTSTTTVDVSTAADGTATYTVSLSSGTSTTTSSAEQGYPDGRTLSVDASGNPVGHESVPLSTLSTAVQNGLTSNAPAGATALTAASLVDVQTENGITTYTADYTTTGTDSAVTVNTAGTLTSLPSTTTATFSTLPAAAQTELQTLATADGVTGAISATQTVREYVEGNGTTVYSVTLDATKTSGTASTTTQTYTITLSVDQSGNPTIPPRGGFGDGFGFGGFGGFGFGGGGCDGGSTPTGTTTTAGTTTTGTTTTGTTTTGTTTTSGTTATASAAVLRATTAATATTGTTTTTATTATTTHKAKKHAHHHHSSKA